MRSLLFFSCVLRLAVVGVAVLRLELPPAESIKKLESKALQGQKKSKP